LIKYFLKNAIPQYRVGHREILNELNACLKEENLSDKFFATGFSYEGVGVNDCVFNARNLVQKVLVKNPIVLAQS
jgi:protoporphyrinogen oxidase